MDVILDGILEVSGVAAALVIDGNGALVAHRGRAVYDRALCETFAGKIAKVTDAVQLQQEDWDAITAQFSDGKLLLRRLGAAAGSGSIHVLAIVADATLNPSFATVAIRVAANKLKKVLSGGTGESTVGMGSTLVRAAAQGSSAGPAAPAAAVPAPPPIPHPPAVDSQVLSGSVSWSRTSSSVMLSRVQAADPASAAFLGRCVKELARQVGPMSKVYVEEAVRRAAGDQPFSMVHGPKVLEDLCGQIEDADDRVQFRKAIQKG